MSASTTEIETEVVSRVPRRDRAAPVTRERETPETLIEVADGLDPESVVMDSARQLKEADQRTATVRAALIAAERRATDAVREVNAARATQLTDRQAIVAQALEGAKESQAAARSAMRVARDAGDVDAEMAATEALATATYRVSQATGELEALKSYRPEPARTEAPTDQGGGNQLSAEAQAWATEHPLYHSDPVYKGAAQGAHFDALNRGIQPDSPVYYDHINDLLSRQFGDRHGQTGEERAQPMNNGRGNSPSARDGLTPSRGASGGGGFSAVKTVLHKDPLQVQKLSNGGMRIRFTSPQQQADFQEGAEACRMSLEEYTQDQIAIAEERAAGGTGDLIHGEGNRYE